MKKLLLKIAPLTALSLTLVHCSSDDEQANVPVFEEPQLNIPTPPEVDLDPLLVDEGREIFRNSSFGDEVFWSGVLQLDEAILGADNGGFGPGFSPSAALGLGLKVDAEALPSEVVEGIKSGSIDLNDPATTVELLRLNAVVGVDGNFDGDGNLASVGITCALCHSTVDDSFSAGIGNRLDGWPNRDINVGAIIAATNTQPLANLLGVDLPTVNTVLNSWGNGRFDGALLIDGRPLDTEGNLIPASVIPAIFGLQGVNPVSYSGFGDLTTWINFVAVVELGAQGNYNDPRLNDAERFPIAAATGAGNTVAENDIYGPQAAALEQYILSLNAPAPNPASFNRDAAIRGQALFNGIAQCVNCHTGPTFTDNILRDPEEIGIDGILANRFPSGQYRTPPLRGLFTKQKEGYFHDGRFATLNDVVNHYNDTMELNLTEANRNDLVQYLNAL